MQSAEPRPVAGGAGAPTGSRRIAGVSCVNVADRLPALIDGPLAARRTDRRVAAHVGQCLRCQAELVSYRRIRRGLNGLRTEVFEPAPGAVASVLTAVAAGGERSAARSLLSDHPGLSGAAISAAAVACGAGAAFVVLIGHRHRR